MNICQLTLHAKVIAPTYAGFWILSRSCTDGYLGTYDAFGRILMSGIVGGLASLMTWSGFCRRDLDTFTSIDWVYTLFFLASPYLGRLLRRQAALDCPAVVENCGQKLCRWFFWVSLLTTKTFLGLRGLELMVQTFNGFLFELHRYSIKSEEITDVFIGILLFFNSFLCFMAYTQFAFSLGCALLGAVLAFAQSGWRCSASQRKL